MSATHLPVGNSVYQPLQDAEQLFIQVAQRTGLDFGAEVLAERLRVGEQRRAVEQALHARAPSRRSRAEDSWLSRRRASARATARPTFVIR